MTAAHGQAVARQQETTTTLSAVSYTGPLPPPVVLREFEDLIPGSAERILRAFEVESSHRRAIEESHADLALHAVKHELMDRRIGLLLGFVIALGALGISAMALRSGHTIEGASGIVGTVASLAAVFVLGRRVQASRERLEDKQLKLPLDPPA